MKLELLDGFTKIESTVTNQKSSGGIVTILAAALMVFLTWSEFSTWLSPRQNYEVVIDADRLSTLRVNLDIIVNTACGALTVDVLDAAGGATHLKPAFEMRPAAYLEDGPTVADVDRPVAEILEIYRKFQESRLGAGDYSSQTFSLPEGDGRACHIRGTAELQKVSGNLHITALGHGYASTTHTEHSEMNFTHRFLDLSFGRHHPALKLANPLSGVMEKAEESFTAFQYFLSIVPTLFMNERTGASFVTSQYAVTEHTRVLKPPAFGVPGIFIRYGIEPISVHITEQRTYSVLHFLVRLCGILGGVFVTVGMAYRVVNRAFSAMANVVGAGDGLGVAQDSMNGHAR